MADGCPPELVMSEAYDGEWDDIEVDEVPVCSCCETWDQWLATHFPGATEVVE